MLRQKVRMQQEEIENLLRSQTLKEYLLTFRPSALIHCDCEDMMGSLYVQNITKMKAI